MAICGSASVSTGPILLTQRAVAPAADRQPASRSAPKTSWISGAMTKVGIVLPAVAVAITA